MNQVTVSPLLEAVSSNSQRVDIDRLLLEALDEVLADLLGRRVRDAFYDYMERHYCVAQEDIPKHLSDFLMLLERTFGKSEKTIEKAVAKRLYAKLGWKDTTEQ